MHLTQDQSFLPRAPANSNRCLRVVHVALSLEVGGLERVIVELVREGRELGQDVSVICLERRGILADAVESVGGNVFALNKPPGLKPAVVGQIRVLLADLRPDVVHTHQIGALLYAGPAARCVGIPAIIHTEHIDNMAKALAPGRRLRTRLLWSLATRHAARFICVSPDIAETAKGIVRSEKVRIVANGIDTRAFADPSSRRSIRAQLSIPETAPVLGTVGRLNEVKSQDLLIRAFAAVRKHVNDAHLILVGDGPEREALTHLVKSLNLSDCVHFAGYQTHPHLYLHAMDVFALSSRLEGMPLVILEAWAARLPIVASRVGGIPQLVRDGVNGLLFDSGDEVGLSKSLLAVLADEAVAARISRAGHERVLSAFDSRHMAGHYQGHYLQVLNESKQTLPRIHREGSQSSPRISV